MEQQDPLETAPAERAEEIRLRHRKRRLVRTVAVLVLTGLGISLFVTLRNDYRLRHRVQDQLVERARRLQETLDRLGKLPPPPLSISATRAADQTVSIRYADDATLRYATQSSLPVMVAWSDEHKSVLLANGRAVIVCRDRKLAVEWLTEEQFQQRRREQRRRIEALRTGEPVEPSEHSKPTGAERH